MSWFPIYLPKVQEVHGAIRRLSFWLAPADFACANEARKERQVHRDNVNVIVVMNESISERKLQYEKHKDVSTRDILKIRTGTKNRSKWRSTFDSFNR